MMIPAIEFVKGIPESLENDFYLDVDIRNLIVIDDQMIEAGKDNRIVTLLTKGSHHRNLSVIYIVQNLYQQGKGNRTITLNSHYLALFENSRDKLRILTLAKQKYPSETAWFIKEYEKTVPRQFGYLFVDLKPTTPNRCRLRTNVLHGEERFDKRFEENKISQELLQYLKQQTLMVPASIPEMKRIQNYMGHLLYRTNLRDGEKAKQYVQSQNKFLTYKYQLKSLIREAPMPAKPQQPNQISTSVLTGDVPTVPKPVQAPPEIITATPVQAPTQVTAPALPPPPPPSLVLCLN